MKNFEIQPHIGVGPVKLGMSQEEVKVVLGDIFYCGSDRSLDYYFSNSLQIEFSEGKADFIGASYSNLFTATYSGTNVFDLISKELFKIIEANESNKHSYNDNEYLFPNQIITLWDADKQYDYIGNQERIVWAQIGIGSNSYLEAVS